MRRAYAYSTRDLRKRAQRVPAMGMDSTAQGGAGLVPVRPVPGRIWPHVPVVAPATKSVAHPPEWARLSAHAYGRKRRRYECAPSARPVKLNFSGNTPNRDIRKHAL